MKVWDYAHCDVSGTDFSEQSLTDANFLDAACQECQFVGTNLSNTCFRGADLRGAYFESANLCGADFWGADIGGAVFRHCRLYSETLHYARFGTDTVLDENTILNPLEELTQQQQQIPYRPWKDPDRSFLLPRRETASTHAQEPQGDSPQAKPLRKGAIYRFLHPQEDV